MRIYLAGPMSGVDDSNFPAFDAARERLESLGHEVLSPADIARRHGYDPEQGEPDTELLMEIQRADLRALADADAVALLARWESSEGACIELEVAQWLGLAILDAETLERVAA